MAHPLLADQSHLPWPLPNRPWVMTQTWESLLFAHWSLPPEHVRALVPPQLTLDTFDGQAWVGVVPFTITGIRGRFLPPVWGFTGFHELNVRTYVTYNGKPGVWFFSLDAAHRLAVEGARTTYSLPYFNARMRMETDGATVRYHSERTDRRGGQGAFAGTYRPIGEPYRAQAGTLEYFLTERYCLYSVTRRGVFRAQIQHPPWDLQAAEAEITTNTVAQHFGIMLPQTAPLLLYSGRQPTLVWPLQRA